MVMAACDLCCFKTETTKKPNYQQQCIITTEDHCLHILEVEDIYLLFFV